MNIGWNRYVRILFVNLSTVSSIDLNFARLYFPMLFAEMVLFVPISIFLKFRLKGDCSLEYSRCCLHDFMLFSFYCMYNSFTTNKTSHFLFFQASLMKK